MSVISVVLPTAMTRQAVPVRRINSSLLTCSPRTGVAFISRLSVRPAANRTRD